MNTDRPLDDKSDELQHEINRLSEALRVAPMQVGLRTNDGLNIYVGEDEYTTSPFTSEEKSVLTRLAVLTTFSIGTARVSSRGKRRGRWGSRGTLQVRISGIKSIQSSMGEKARARARRSFSERSARRHRVTSRYR